MKSEQPIKKGLGREILEVVFLLLLLRGSGAVDNPLLQIFNASQL